jgi:hypothetical protein
MTRSCAIVKDLRQDIPLGYFYKTFLIIDTFLGIIGP